MNASFTLQTEIETVSPALYRFYDLTRLITSEGESRCVAIDFHCSSKGLLRTARHRVRFVQYDDLVSTRRQRDFLLCKCLDLVAHDIDASFVRGVQFQNTFFVR
jgi:hypothetical protein